MGLGIVRRALGITAALSRCVYIIYHGYDFLETNRQTAASDICRESKMFSFDISRDSLLDDDAFR